MESSPQLPLVSRPCLAVARCSTRRSVCVLRSFPLASSSTPPPVGRRTRSPKKIPKNQTGHTSTSRTTPLKKILSHSPKNIHPLPSSKTPDPSLFPRPNHHPQNSNQKNSQKKMLRLSVDRLKIHDHFGDFSGGHFPVVQP